MEFGVAVGGVVVENGDGVAGQFLEAAYLEATGEGDEVVEHAEALAYLEDNDIVISRDNPMDRYLEVQRDGGKTYFVPKDVDPGREVAG